MQNIKDNFFNTMNGKDMEPPVDNSYQSGGSIQDRCTNRKGLVGDRLNKGK